MYVTFNLRRLLAVIAVACCLLFFIFSATRVSASADEENKGTCVPVVMYHHVTENSALLGKYVLSVEQLERDLIYLNEHGYTTMLMEEIVQYQERGIPLPAKPVVLTFDDGQESLYGYVYPLLEKYDMKAVFNIVGEYVDRYTQHEDHDLNYSCLNWTEVAELAASGRVEIGNHSYDMHRSDKGRTGCKRLPGESDEQYASVLNEDLGVLQQLLQEHTGREAITFAYPFGMISKGSVEILQEMGFQVLLTCEERLNYTGNEGWLLSVGRFNRPSWIDSKSFFENTMELKG